MKKRLLLLLFSFIIALPLFSCSGGGSGGGTTLPQILEKKGQYSLSGYSFNVDVSGNWAVISNEYGDFYFRLMVVDISDKENPQLFASMGTGYNVPGIVIDGDTVYIARNEYIEDSKSKSGWGTRLQQIDLSTNSLNVLQDRTLPLYANGLALYQGYLYLVAEEGITAIKADEIETYVYTLTGSNISTRIFIDSNAERAYVSGQNNLLDIFDISDPANPVLLNPGSVENPYPSEGSPSSIAVKDGYVAFPWNSNGIVLLDISNLSDIQLVDVFETGDSAIDLAYFDHYAFVADGEDGIQIMDITNPENPVQVGRCPTSGASWKLKLIGNDLFVLDRDLGLIIYDISGL